MLSNIMTWIVSAMMLAWASSCAAIDIPPEPTRGSIDLNWNATSSSYYISLSLAPGPNIYSSTSGGALIGGVESYTSVDMFFNYTGASTGWTLWAVPTSYGGHVIDQPLTTVWEFGDIPVPEACAYTPITQIDQLTYPADFEWWGDCGMGGFPVFHSAAYGFEVSLNEPVTVVGL
ncbi:hypothetical protein DACRYDRAFT_95710 [Dacryopinax primogenitus]|uniref:CBD9-like protein n=1 Tax=Dacryopinax primogenitus (strain DJM 731) TaxID=1858805 RepID=M5FPK5_DACPD|nr:uncharacterized protein DACRYDRAFT_120069 [Dacryopinax primogenitus]XP_040626727.1 uncharacterized protein DACRYDRAFT_95710 [Dacryopinax primogenitus]EJT96489.1 hypothetical protein DACRYDRAFT_120069 [Dacryopinax primogenitus]EJT99829.1 hypothetical protein DACRYDRAFT_95710 [Dacryopinax primogenitus]